MLKIIFNLLASAAAVLISAWVIPGVEVTNVGSAILVAIVLSFLNAFLRPLLILLTLPVTIFTLGLFLIVINVLMILLAEAIVPGFHVAGFWSALFFGIVLAIVSALFGINSKPREESKS